MTAKISASAARGAAHRIAASPRATRNGGSAKSKRKAAMLQHLHRIDSLQRIVAAALGHAALACNGLAYPAANIMYPHRGGGAQKISRAYRCGSRLLS